MKKLLLSLLAVAGMMTAGTSTASAEVAVLAYDNGTVTAAASAPSGFSTLSYTNIGFDLQLTGNAAKEFTAGGGSVTYSSKSYRTIKNSNGAQMTCNLPEGCTASQVDFYAVTNDATTSGKLTEIAGVSCEETVVSLKDYKNPTKITKALDNVSSFTFTFSTKQVCFIAVVTYANAAPTLTASSSASVTATQSGVEATTDIAVSGNNLTGSTLTATLSPAVEGLSVTLSESAITAGAISAIATLHYTATANTSGTTTLTLSDGTTSKEVTVNYAANVVSHELQSISAATSWDWSKVSVNNGSVLFGDNGIKLTGETTPSTEEYVVYADYQGVHMTFANGFDANTIAFKGQYPSRNGTMCQNGTIKFNTTVPGTISVKFSDTGSSVDASATPRYLNVNGENTEYWTSRPTSGSSKSNDTKTASNIFVPAGEVTITGMKEDGVTSTAICVYTVTFTPAVSITIGAAGYATYVAPCALDFTDNAIEAYAVSSVSATSVTLSPLTTVPAGEAIIVKGATGNVPVIASAAAITNELVAATAPVTATGSEYVLAQQEGNVVFAPVKAGVEIPAGKAYLTSLSGAASLRIDIEGMEDGMQTGISEINAAANAGAMFDLEGRRANGKGLMIQNGKVVLVK